MFFDLSWGTKRRKNVRDCFQEPKSNLKGSHSCCCTENMACEVLKWWCASFLLLGRRQSRKSLWTKALVCIPQKTCPLLFLQIILNIYGGVVTRNPCKTLGKTRWCELRAPSRVPTKVCRQDFKSKAKPSVLYVFHRVSDLTFMICDS